jgi:hypothetical protein
MIIPRGSSYRYTLTDRSCPEPLTGKWLVPPKQDRRGQGAQLKQYFLSGKPGPVAGELHYSLHYLIDNEIDLSLFDTRYRNDEMVAPAYDPAILLKIIKMRNCVTNRGSLDERN